MAAIRRTPTTTVTPEASRSRFETGSTSTSIPAFPRFDPTKLDAPLSAGGSSPSPLLPTLLETLFLAIYPSTLLLGTVFSALHPSTRSATYLVDAQSYDPRNAPSYFAKKSNVFNVYFVKKDWIWTTAVFFLFVCTHPSLGPSLQAQFTRRRRQAVLRYLAVTTVWVVMTQWFFGPAIIDRSFRWTGGQCRIVQSDSLAAQAAREDFSDARDIFTGAACKAIGGTWRGGHDISGHVFLLMLSSAMLCLEVLPAVLRANRFTETRVLRTSGGLVRSAAVEAEVSGAQALPQPHSAVQSGRVGVQAALAVAALSWWMLLMTAAFFHTWFEKLTGSLVAFVAIYTVYFLPRAVPVLRQVLGMPGV